MRQIILDTETSGLNPQDGHRIIEFGAVVLENRRFTGESLQIYMNPERLVDPGAQAIHGISDDFLKDKPPFSEIADSLWDFLTTAEEWIIHNAPFDLSFLDAEFSRINPYHTSLGSQRTIIDTLQLARQMHPGQRNNLDALCKRYGIDNSERQLHGAHLDATLTARVYLAMTAGQMSLFGESVTRSDMGSSPVTKSIASDTPKQRTAKLVVRTATAEELQRHEEMLKILGENR